MSEAQTTHAVQACLGASACWGMAEGNVVIDACLWKVKTSARPRFERHDVQLVSTHGDEPRLDGGERATVNDLVDVDNLPSHKLLKRHSRTLIRCFAAASRWSLVSCAKQDFLVDTAK